MKISLIFRSSEDAETAWIKYFENGVLNYKKGTIEIEVGTGETLELPENAIAIIF